MESNTMDRGDIGSTNNNRNENNSDDDNEFQAMKKELEEMREKQRKDHEEILGLKNKLLEKEFEEIQRKAKQDKREIQRLKQQLKEKEEIKQGEQKKAQIQNNKNESTSRQEKSNNDRIKDIPSSVVVTEDTTDAMSCITTSKRENQYKRHHHHQMEVDDGIMKNSFNIDLDPDNMAYKQYNIDQKEKNKQLEAAAAAAQNKFAPGDEIGICCREGCELCCYGLGCCFWCCFQGSRA